MIKLTETIVKRPIAAVMFIAAIILFGLMAIFTMPQELTPDMDMPMLVISTIYPGAGPGDVEDLVSSVIKDTVSAENGVRSVISQSMENVSIIILQFEYGTDIDRAYNHVSRSVSGVVNNLPDDAMTPIVMTIDINAMPTMTLSIHSETREHLLHFVEDEIVPQFTRLGSVASVDVHGGREEYIRVELLEERLREHNLSMHNVIAAVSGVNHTAPLGHAAFGNIDLAVRVQVRHESLEALNNIPLTLPTGGVIRLGDVTDIYISTMETSSISRHNGMENITLQIQNPQAESPNRTSQDVLRVVESIRAEHPDISVVVINDNSVLIANSINSVAQTLMLAIGLSMLILFLFLGDIRACLIVGSSMPISLLVTFMFMDFMGFTMNLITLSGLIIGVGMMVDNAIVVIDSCFRARKETKSFQEAAIEGTKFVMLSVFAVTLTTIVVFLPLALIEGMSGQMFAPLGLSIVFALLASLISAVTLVPLFFVQFKPIEREKAPVSRIFKRLENGYARVLNTVLNKKKTVLLCTVIIMVLSVYLVSFINFELMPPIDDGIVAISVTTRPGLNMESIDAILMELEEMVSMHPDVSHFSLTSGLGGATLSAYLKSDRQMHTNEVMEQWRFDTMHMVDTDIDISAGGMFMMPGNEGVEVTLEAYTLAAAREGASIIDALMHQHPDVIRVNSTIDRANPQAEIVIDPLMAASHNITPQMATGSIFLALNGTEAAEITIANQRFAIRVEYPPGRYDSVSDVANMMLMSPTGAMVPLSSISSLEFTDTPHTISRQNNLYMVTVTAIVTDEARFTAQADIQNSVREIEFPEGVRLGLGVMEEMQNDEFMALGQAILTAIFLVFMIMAIQFESIRHSLMVMTCVPLAVIGSFLLMFLTGTTISMVSLLGFLILIGLVINNGILFVDTTNKYREKMDLKEALVLAGRTRLRPILMTTLTTVLAMMPLAMGLGDEMMQGMGVTVIGGLSASTVLTLLFLPTFYLLIDGNPKKRADNKQRRIEKREKKIADAN